ncbi:unnamed protein product [Lactuca saligna]|uniref:Uncharacterized protein n=1 Tax=Lactuca saligna TaxID=75948 RepID=A0AA36ENP2_LACSI|nr:unnamed protein product [Lactuca saligna]
MADPSPQGVTAENHTDSCKQMECAIRSMASLISSDGLKRKINFSGLRMPSAIIGLVDEEQPLRGNMELSFEKQSPLPTTNRLNTNKFQLFNLFPSIEKHTGVKLGGNFSKLKPNGEITKQVAKNILNIESQKLKDASTFGDQVKGLTRCFEIIDLDKNAVPPFAEKTLATISLSLNVGVVKYGFKETSKTDRRNGECMMIKKHRKIRPLKAKASNFDIRSVPPIITAMAATAVVTNLASQPLKKEILIICAMAIIINFCMGWLRKSDTDKFSRLWFIAILGAMPFTPLIFYSLVWPPMCTRELAYTVGASLLGQVLGGMIWQYRHRAPDATPTPMSDIVGGGSHSEGDAATPPPETKNEGDATTPRLKLKALVAVGGGGVSGNGSHPPVIARLGILLKAAVLLFTTLRSYISFQYQKAIEPLLHHISLFNT